MTKIILAAIALTISATSAYAGSETRPIKEGSACAQEGQRGYKAVGENKEVYVCENGVWTFLYLQTPDDNKND